MLGVWLVCFVAPLFVSTAFRDSFVLPKVLPLALGSLALWLAGGLTAGRRCKMDTGMMVLGLSLLASTWGSIDVPTSLLGIHQAQFYAVLPLLLCGLIFYGTAYLAPEEESVGLALLVSGLAVSFHAMVQAAHMDRWLGWSMQDGRAGATFGSPVFLGSFLCMVIPVAFHWAQKQGWKRLMGLSGIFMGIVALGAARSRGGIIASILGVMVYAVLAFQLPKKLLLAPLVIGLAVCFLHPSSDLCRFETWKMALLTFKKYPLFGSGPDTFAVAFRHVMTPEYVKAWGNDFTIQTSAHNDVLQVMATMGLFGLLGYAVFLLGAFLVAEEACMLSDEAKGLTAALAALFMQAKVNPVPLAVIAIAAVILGVMDRGEELERSRWRAPVCIVLSLALCLLSMEALRAERLQRRGEDFLDVRRVVDAAEMYNRAAQANPWDIYYTQRQLDLTWASLPLIDARQRVRLANITVQNAGRACRFHPYDPTAHELLGLAFLYKGLTENHDTRLQADEEFAFAEKLAPHCLAYHRRREDLHL